MTEFSPVKTVTLAESDMMPMSAYPRSVRKFQFIREAVFDETGSGDREPVVRVAGLAVFANAWCTTRHQDLHALATLGEELATVMMPDLVAMLGAPALAYGKAAIVGTGGQLEHGAALLHPLLGRPVRLAIGGGTAVIPSNNKIGATGCTIDVPLGHKDDAWSFAFIDTLTLSMSDAPREDEIALFLALASGRRQAARIGLIREERKLNDA